MTAVSVFAAIFDAQQRILCVRHNYGSRQWALPGGRLEPGESVPEGLKREVREETGYVVEPGRLIGVYSAPTRDDVVIFLEAHIHGRDPWQPGREIADLGFFWQDSLPEPMRGRSRDRASDAFAGEPAVLRVFDDW